MITPEEKGILKGYLMEAPAEIRGIVNKIQTGNKPTQQSFDFQAESEHMPLIDLNQDLLKFIDPIDINMDDGYSGTGTRALHFLRGVHGRGNDTLGKFLQLSVKDWRKCNNFGTNSINHLKSVFKKQCNIIVCDE